MNVVCQPQELSHESDFFGLFESLSYVEKSIFVYRLPEFFDNCGYLGSHPEIVQICQKDLVDLQTNSSFESTHLVSANAADLNAVVLQEVATLTMPVQSSTVLLKPFGVKAILESTSSRRDPLTGVKSKTSAYYALSPSAFDKLKSFL